MNKNLKKKIKRLEAQRINSRFKLYLDIKLQELAKDNKEALIDILTYMNEGQSIKQPTDDFNYTALMCRKILLEMGILNRTKSGRIKKKVGTRLVMLIANYNLFKHLNENKRGTNIYEDN